MARCGDVYENRVTGERGVVLRGTEDNDEQPARVHLIVQPRGAVAGEHIHPRVREGSGSSPAGSERAWTGVERTVTAGGEAVAVPGTWHGCWNPGEVDARVLLELSPLDPWFEQMIGTMYGLANAGKTNAKGMPTLLQPAMTGREFRDVAQYARPPHAVQRVMLLGPLGQVCGYRGIYPGYCHPRGRTAPDPNVLVVAGLAPPDPNDLTGTRP
jgi:hypothetical protein